MAKMRGTSLISGAVALALGAAAITVPVTANAETKSNLNQPLACNLQLKDPGAIPAGQASGVEGVYNAANSKYSNFRINLRQTAAPDSVEKGQEFDYVIDAGTVSIPGQINAFVTAYVSKVSQLNLWYELPANAEYVSHTQEGGLQGIKVEKVGNKLRLWIPEPEKGSKDVTKWSKDTRGAYAHGGAEATKSGTNFNIALPKVTVKLKATGAPGSTIQAGFPKADADKFGSDLPIQFYADASAKFLLSNINANGFIRCGLSEDDSYWPREKNGTNLTSTKFSAVKITAPTHATSYAPKAKAPVTITQGEALPKAEDQIADFAQLPAGTTATWTTKHENVGENQAGRITVTYPDKTTDTVNIAVTVKAPYVPQAKSTPTTVQVGSEILDDSAQAQIGNASNAPEGTTFVWKTKPDTSTVAEGVQGVVTVTAPGKAPQDVTVAYNVQAEPVVWAPEADESVVEVELDSEIGDEAAETRIINAADAPENTTFVWKTKPDTSKSGAATGTVTVTVPGKDPQDVEVKYTVKEKPAEVPADPQDPAPVQPREFMPKAKESATEVVLNAVVEDGDARAQIADADKAPAGTTFVWKSKPDTSKVGAVTGVVTVTVPGKDPQDVTVNYTVKAESDGTVNPGQPQGGRTVVVKGAMAGATVRVEGNSDVITADQEGTFEIPHSWIPADGKFDVIVTGADGKQAVFSVDVVKGTATKKLGGKEIAGAVLGSLASVAAIIASFIPIPGLKGMITNVQQQLGIFNPQLAGAAEKALPFIGTMLGIVGLGVSIGTAVGKIKVEVQDQEGKQVKPAGSSQKDPNQDA